MQLVFFKTRRSCEARAFVQPFLPLLLPGCNSREGGAVGLGFRAAPQLRDRRASEGGKTSARIFLAFACERTTRQGGKYGKRTPSKISLSFPFKTQIWRIISAEIVFAALAEGLAARPVSAFAREMDVI